MAQKLFNGAQNEILTRQAAEALTAYRFVKPNATYSQKVDMCDTAGEDALGVVQASWSSGDEAVAVTVKGFCEVQIGAAVAVGDYLAVDASGRAVPVDSDDQYIVAKAHTAGSTAGDRITVDLMHVPSALALTDGQRKVKRIAMATPADGSEQDTGWDLPAVCIVHGAWVYVVTAEATGGTKTVDVGTDGSGSNDPDGFLDGVSVAATGLVTGAPTFTTGSNEVYFASSTMGDLLAPVQVAGSDVATDVGTYFEDPKGDLTSGGESVTWTPGSADFAEFEGFLFIVYTALSVS